MNWTSRRNEQSQDHSDAAHLVCAGHETEIVLVKNELSQAGIASEMRRHPMAEALGVNGVELWIRNKEDLSNASKLCNRLQGKAANSPKAPSKAETSGASGSGPKPQPQAEPSSNDASKVESVPVVQPQCSELKEASSLLQKGIEQLLAREGELTSKCTLLHSNVEELTKALAQAQADVVSEIKKRETVEQSQNARVNSVLDTLTQKRQEWLQKLKSSNDACKQATEQASSLSRLLQAQQATAAELKQEVATLKLQSEQQEQALSDARKETAAEREIRVAAEERAARAEKSLQTEAVGRQELERQIQAHAASLGSLLAKVTAPGQSLPALPSRSR